MNLYLLSFELLLSNKLTFPYLQAQGYRLKTKSLEEVLKMLRTMEARLVGYDEMPLSVVSSSDLPHVGNLCLEEHSSTCVNLELSIGNLSLNDYPLTNGRASPEPNVYEMPTITSSSQRNSTRAPISFPKRQQNSQCTEDVNCTIDSDVHGTFSCFSEFKALHFFSMKVALS